MRRRAVFCALLYGLAPSSWYEPEPHYQCSYREHLAFNLRYAARWLLRLENEADWLFEQEVNAKPVRWERCSR